MRLALAMIARSADAEHKDLALSLDSAKAAGFTDLVIAVDDRSHENTVEWVRARWGENADVFTYVMEADGDPHFANARNLTLPRIPKECEWWGWMDSDDVIESVSGETIPAMLAKLKGEVGALAFTYHYADDEYGNAKGHLKVRLFRTSIGWKWRDRVHEDCEPTGGKRMGLDIVVVQDGEEKEFRWVHHSENKVVQPGRNFRCLRRMIADDPDYPRAWFYLANQHFAAHNWRLAAEAYERYVPMSGWDEERWWALVYSAIAYRAVGEYDTAVDRDLEAHSLLPNLADAYFGLGETYCRKGEWENAVRWGELGMERLVAEDKGSPQNSIPSNRIWFNANAYQFQPYTWMAVAYNNLGQPEKALSCYEQAFKARPEPEIASNIALIKAALERRRVTHNGIDLAAGLAKNGEPLKALNVLASLPAGSDDDANVLRMRAFIQKQVEHLRDRTAYQNFYFGSEEFNDPLDEGTSDEALEQFVPRMMWALRRLQAVGAKRVLDIGIGDGTFAFLLARHGIQVVGIDVDWRRAQNANKNAVRAGYQSEKTIDLEPLIEFSGDCACEEEDTAHGFEGCKAEGCVCEAKWVETQAGSTLTVPEATPESMAQFLYCPPDQITPQVRALAPYDAVVGMELIEHVQDPEQTLTLIEEMAPRILLSTPDGGWNGPDPVEPRSRPRVQPARPHTPRRLARLADRDARHPARGERAGSDRRRVRARDARVRRARRHLLPADGSAVDPRFHPHGHRRERDRRHPRGRGVREARQAGHGVRRVRGHLGWGALPLRAGLPPRADGDIHLVADHRAVRADARVLARSLRLVARHPLRRGHTGAARGSHGHRALELPPDVPRIALPRSGRRGARQRHRPGAVRRRARWNAQRCNDVDGLFQRA
jgi:2-polyprenyl-3-methyl-5-hydroxy-6-metoxy-1,4-benzoquinol methylase/cytochrome c-type biogenesis protein CcmH/NrfG